MSLPLQDFTTLVRNMTAAIQGSSRALLDLTVGSVLRAVIEANAALALWLQWLILQVLSLTRAATSQGLDLDSWTADFGLSRLPGSPATGLVTFSRVSPGLAASIPPSTIVRTADASQSFVVVVDTTNAAWSSASNAYSLSAAASSVAIPVVAMSSGSLGNVQAGAIAVLTSSIPGIDTVFNPGPLAGGSDAETDAALRLRFTNFIDSRSRATNTAVAYTIMSIQQGLTFVIAENQDTSGALRLGNFVVTVDDGSGAPPASLLATVTAAVDAIRPLGSMFSIRAPVVIGATIVMTVSAPASQKASAVAAIGSAIGGYINGLTIATPLAFSRLAALAYAANSAVTNVSLITLNGGTADLVPPANGVIKLSGLTVN